MVVAAHESYSARTGPSGGIDPRSWSPDLGVRKRAATATACTGDSIRLRDAAAARCVADLHRGTGPTTCRRSRCASASVVVPGRRWPGADSQSRGGCGQDLASWGRPFFDGLRASAVSRKSTPGTMSIPMSRVPSAKCHAR